MTPSWYQPSRWSSVALPSSANPPDGVRRFEESDMCVVFLEGVRAQMGDLIGQRYEQTRDFINGLPQRHVNDTMRVLPRDSKVFVHACCPDVQVTYVVVLSLGAIIITNVGVTEPEE